jgi:hypothetical protein
MKLVVRSRVTSGGGDGSAAGYTEMVDRRVLAAAPSLEWPKGSEKAENKLVCSDSQRVQN